MLDTSPVNSSLLSPPLAFHKPRVRQRQGLQADMHSTTKPATSPPILLSIGQVSAPREMPLPQYLCVRRLAIRIHSMVVSFSILNKQVTRQPSTRCQSFCFREPSLYTSVTLVQLPYRWDDLTLKQQPCYPESAVVIGSNPPLMNPGTDVPNTPNPGTNCNDPGPYHGAYSLGNRFPIYVVATHCSNKDEWRINYNAYYV